MVSPESFSTPFHSHKWSSREHLKQPIAQSVPGLTFSLLLALTTALPAIAQPSLPPGQEPRLLAQGAALQEAYTLGPGDRIQIDIFNVPEYSGENGQHQVLVDGTLNLPLVGRVSVEGLTLEQAAGRLRNLYAPYLQRPEFLTISLMERRPVQVGISGEVRRPGSYIIPMNEAGGNQRPTITTAIERAGGISSTANIRQVQLLRRTRGGPNQLITIDLTTLVQLGDLSQDITIRDGDTIFIPPDPNINANDARQLASASISGDSSQPINIAVVGEINKPGSYTVAGATETGGLLTLTRALQTAGGVTQSAEVGQIQVRRQPKSGPAQILSVNLWQLLNGDISQDIILQQGDTIFVPTGSGFSPAESSRLAQANFAGDPSQPVNIAVVGEVSRPGSYTVTRMDETGGLLTVTRALQTAGGVTQSAEVGQIQVRRQPQAGPAQILSVNLWQLLNGDISQDIILQQGDTIFVPTGSGFSPVESSRLAQANFAGDPTQPVNIAVVGEVSRPGSYTVTRMDETGGLLTVTRALQTAGGVTQSAQLGEIQVLRQPQAGPARRIPVNLWALLRQGDLSQDIILQQGDTIYVPTGTGFNAAESTLLAEASFAGPRNQPVNIAVSGEVTRPGSYTVTRVDEAGGLLTVTRALQTAGGVTLSADIREIRVNRRPKAGSPQTIVVNLWEMLDRGDFSQDIILQQGDTIEVPTASNPNSIESARIATANFAANTATPLNIAIVGEVNRPGTYTVSGEDVGATGNLETLTAPGTGGAVVGLPTVTRAIKIAGGITPTADIRRVQVLRQRKNGTQQLIDVNLWELLENGNLNQDVLLQQGDTIVVQTATNIDLAEAPRLATASFSPNRIQVNIVGEIQEPGVVELPPNASLNQAILVAGGFNNTRAEKDEVELIRLNSNGTVSRQTIPIDFAQGLDEGTNPILRNNDVIVVGRTGLARFGDRISPVGQVTNSVFSLFGILRFFNLF